MKASLKMKQASCFTIGNFEIGEYSRVFIIAEAGVNHNQNLDLALNLVDIAAEAGADAVKFQTFKADEVVTADGQMASYQIKNLGRQISQREMLKNLELPEDFYKPIIEQCKKRKILFLSTPHGGKKSVDFLESLSIQAYKVGSGDLTNYILLNKIARIGKPIILSTGMATLVEIKEAIDFIRSRGNDQIAVLHCTTNYPCPPEEVNLLAMKTMMEELDVPIGYSDHTDGNNIEVAIAAASLGMAIYECHFTKDKSLPGPDHIASANPEELKAKIQAIRQIQVILGDSKKTPNQKEVELQKTIRRSIVANSDLSKGHIISEDDLEAKRPGTAISANQYEKLLNKRLKLDVKKDQNLTFEQIE